MSDPSAAASANDSRAAASASEINRLALLLDVQPDYLQRFEAAEIRSLRTAVAQAMHRDNRRLFARMARASALLPAKATAALAQRSLSPRTAADVVGEMPPRHAADLAARMAPGYRADVCLHLAPDAVAPVLALLDASVVFSTRVELEERRDVETMAELVLALRDDQTVKVMESITDPLLLLEVLIRGQRSAARRAAAAARPAAGIHPHPRARRPPGPLTTGHESSGGRQRSPGNRAKPRSVVTQVAPCSIASAARKASGTTLARAATSRQRPVKIPQCWDPARTGMAAGASSTAAQNDSAVSRGVGSRYTRWFVAMRTKADSTSSLTPTGSAALSTPCNQARCSSARGLSRRWA